MEILGKKGGVTVSAYNKLQCCNKEIKNAELWILEDFKGFTKRKLLVGTCSVCKDKAVLQIMTNTQTNKTYFNLYNGIEAVKTLYRENKRKLQIFPDIKTNDLYGWVFGINTQIKKKGKITQIRQYSSDFKGKRKLVKKIFLN